jgi:dipeptidyl-peptidase-3
MRESFGVLFALLAAFPTAAQEPSRPSPLVDRVGATGFLQVEAPSFEKLTPKEKLVAYHLTRAAIQLDPITYDQFSSYGLQAKRLLGALVEKPERLPAELRAPVFDYAKLFFANNGNRNDTTGAKFLPAFTFEDLSRAAEAARAAGARLPKKSQLERILKELKQPLFDPDFARSITEKNPPAGGDILTASSNNYYANVRLADLDNFSEKNALNSRLVKREGRLVEEIYRAGTPDGTVPPGLYAKELSAVNRELELAARAAAPDQAAVLRALIHFYQTGDLKDWEAYNILWVKNSPPVDFASGFIEVYRDARGAKGSAQMFVSTEDRELDPLMKRLAAEANYFEQKAPWLEKYKKANVSPPAAVAIESVAETGDFNVTTIGDNLPNEQSIREKYGTKSYFFSSSVRAFNETRGSKVVEAYAADRDDVELYSKYGTMASNLETAMHEIIGHGSGKVVVPDDPARYLREYFSTLEEARADLVAAWDVYDPKLQELGVADLTAVGHEMYRQFARVGLTTLRSYPEGDQAEEDHDRNRLLIVNVLIEAGAFERVKENGHWYIRVKDYDKAHQVAGQLLAEIMRIKAEGDYEAAKALVTKYGIKFDPAIRDDVIARYKQLNLPTYWAGVSADLAAVKNSRGEIVDVKISYPRDFLKQQIEFAKENGTLGF